MDSSCNYLYRTYLLISPHLHFTSILTISISEFHISESTLFHDSRYPISCPPNFVHFGITTLVTFRQYNGPQHSLVHALCEPVDEVPKLVGVSMERVRGKRV